MAVSHCLTFCLTIIFSILTLHCSASSSSSSSISSDQLKFWSQNVQNPMSNSILKKLSPLTKKDSVYYTNILLKGDEFRADAKFCSLANLDCESIFDNVKTVTQTYTTTKTYGASPGLRQMKTNEDPFSFFRQSILKKGDLIHLPNLQDSLPNRAFLPTQIVSKIPFTYEAIAKIFPKSAIGTTKETIQASLSYCSAAAIEGETKSCPKTLQEMVGFAKSTLGKKKLWALTSKIESEGPSSEMMMIREMKKYPVEKIVACHEAFLPFAAYFCHSSVIKMMSIAMHGDMHAKKVKMLMDDNEHAKREHVYDGKNGTNMDHKPYTLAVDRKNTASPTSVIQIGSMPLALYAS